MPWTRVVWPIAVSLLPAGTTQIALELRVEPGSGGAASLDNAGLYAGSLWTTNTNDSATPAPRPPKGQPPPIR